MHSKSLIAIAAVVTALAGTIPANSQPMPPGFRPPPGPPGGRPPSAVAINHEAEMIGLHQLCDRGDKQACIRFGFLLGQSTEHHAEWRRSHAEWWAWDRH